MNRSTFLLAISRRCGLFATAVFLCAPVANAEVSPGKFTGTVADVEFDVLGNCEVSNESFQFRTFDAMGLADTSGDGIFVLVNKIENDWIMRVVKDEVVLFNGLSGEFSVEEKKYSLDKMAKNAEGTEDIKLDVEINCE